MQSRAGGSAVYFTKTSVCAYLWWLIVVAIFLLFLSLLRLCSSSFVLLRFSFINVPVLLPYASLHLFCLFVSPLRHFLCVLILHALSRHYFICVSLLLYHRYIYSLSAHCVAVRIVLSRSGALHCRGTPASREGEDARTSLFLFFFFSTSESSQKSKMRAAAVVSALFSSYFCFFCV